MWLLLKYQGYPPAVLIAVLLHGLLLYFIFDKGLSTSDFVDVEKPVVIRATAVRENPQRARKLEQQRKSVLAQQARNVAAREEQLRQETAAKAKVEREKAEADQKVKQQKEIEEVQRLASERELKEQQAKDREKEAALREEQLRQELIVQEQIARQAEAQRQAEQITVENQQIQSYTTVIHDAVVQNWSRPPSARNGMTVLLMIQLVPTGEVVSVTVRESSGDDAVDRSAIQAVRRIGRFYDLEGMPIGLFEREFRSFNLRFRPEDLLR